MKKKKKVLIEHDIEYKKVPHIGTCGWVAIIGVVFLIGLAVYYKYFMGREILTCTQDSTIVLNDKISVSQCRKKEFEKDINGKKYKCYAVFYPVGNGRFNIGKSIEDIKYIIDNINDRK